jgi:hypothetical protein
MSRQIWGCYAVNDHLQKNAFVADVLLFERLVIPVPPENDPEALRPWEENWEPDQQRELLDILGGIACQVPWSSALRGQFQKEWATMELDAEADEWRRFPGNVSPEAAGLTAGLLGRNLTEKILGQADVQALNVYADPLK